LPPNTAYSRGFNVSCDAHSTRMVNDRFPAQSIYSFEMVDAPIAPALPCSRPSIENLHRIKSFGFSANLPQCKHLQFIDG
jgi:hypothetical protein